MKNNFTLSWTIANALGLSLGFLAFIQTLHFYSYGFNFDLHWDFEAGQKATQALEEYERTLFLLKGLSFALPVFGLVYTTSQAIILKSYLKEIWKWVVGGVFGFLLVMLIVFPFTSIWGDIPGPVEPFTIVFGGALITLVFQWKYLRKNGILPAKLFFWYVLGVITGLAFLFILFLVGMNVSWALEIAIIGLIIGAFAGFLSAKHFLIELTKVKN